MGIIQFKKMKELIKLKYMNQKISRQMLPKIKAPKFKVASKFILNEYELRCLLLEVAKGNIQSGISVMDIESKQKGFINYDGSISTRIGNGLKINAEFSIELMEHCFRKIKELSNLLGIDTYELSKLCKEKTIKLDSLGIIGKFAMATMDIKNQKNKI